MKKGFGFALVDRRVGLKEITRIRVRVISVAEGWAMVRRPGCVPFVVRERELLPDDGPEQEPA